MLIGFQGSPLNHSRKMSSYETWSKEDLIARVLQLEGNTASSLGTDQKKSFDFNAYSRRKIALKFCYSGWEYNGLAFQTSWTPLPTVEGTIFDALSKAKLIDPEAGYDGCGWEKCGRTDRGVSAAGQVISLWVRSTAERVEKIEQQPPASVTEEQHTPELDSEDYQSSDSFGFDFGPEDEFSSSLSNNLNGKSEHNYVSILNRLLPDTIRILAWSPVSPTFSARFACQSRHYKYFFLSEGLDLAQMQHAASRLVGLHDFRNLCKLDTSKQITMFKRNILLAQLEPVDGTPGLYVLNLKGSAFLYHQVRHIMSVLFLVGKGLEPPSVVTSLLNVEQGSELAHDDEPLEVVSSKPEYQMADALPLMLWDCEYSPENLDWRTHGGEDFNDTVEESTSVYRHLHSIHERSMITTALNNHFLQAGMIFHKAKHSSMVRVPLGGGTVRRTTVYTPILLKNRLDTVDVMNARWLRGQGLRREQKKKADDDEE
ncbi:pseudouridine synthase [Mycena floridula]|nr:pseudouridine synthase [Mycena floridula]